MTRTSHSASLASRRGQRLSLLLCMGLFCGLLAACQQALAQIPDLVWANDSQQYDWYANFGNGGQGTPSVSLYGNTVVEVHDGGNGYLYYHTGTLINGTLTVTGTAFNGTVQLSNGTIFWNDYGVSFQYDTYGNFGNGGHGAPSVSLNGNTVVEVHQGGNGSLWYRTGTTGMLPNGMIYWNNSGNAIEYDDGYSPSVSVYGNTVVEVHAGGGYLWYRTGTLSNGVINWNSSDHQYASGSSPAINLNGNAVVEVHADSNGNLYSRTGTLSNGVINWSGSASWYGSGLHPSISVYGNTALEVHDGNNGKLLYNIGFLYSGGISWTWPTAQQYDWYENFGKGGHGTPSVSVYGYNVVEVHDGGNGTLYYHLGLWQPL